VDSVVVFLTIADVESGQRSEFSQSLLLRSAGIGWSPDGTRLALGGLFFGECPPVRVFHLDGSEEQRLDVGCYRGATLRSPAWSPDGLQIAFVASVATPDTEIGTLGLADITIPGDSAAPAGCTFQDAHSVSWSPDGSRLAVAAGGIFVVDLASATCTMLTDDSSGESPSWSPDGSRLAFSSSRDGNSEIYVMQADGSNQTRITRSPLDDFAPSWRP
jgi:Tol biopolymer transport system component